MKQQRARMKAGHRPIVVECMLVPEYPTYWHVPESVSAAVELLVADGLIEYEPAFSRGAGGTFAPELALQQVAVAPAAGGPKPFARKAPRS